MTASIQEMPYPTNILYFFQNVENPVLIADNNFTVAKNSAFGCCFSLIILFIIFIFNNLTSDDKYT